MSEPPHEVLNALLTYDPLTGSLRWKVRIGRRDPDVEAGHTDHKGHRRIKIGRRKWMAHRIIWIMYHKAPIPVGAQIDHKNNEKGDNRIENLRLASGTQNGWNRSVTRSSRSGLKGVTLHKASGLWAATIKAKNIRHHLGYFKTPEEAHEAYKAAALKLHGEYAKT